MRKPRPTQEALDDKIKIIQKNDSWKDGEPPVELWGYMLDLIYSGNAKVAWQFFDKALVTRSCWQKRVYAGISNTA